MQNQLIDLEPKKILASKQQIRQSLPLNCLSIKTNNSFIFKKKGGLPHPPLSIPSPTYFVPKKNECKILIAKTKANGRISDLR